MNQIRKIIQEEIQTLFSESEDPKEILFKLYNGIMNDASIQRYTMGWEDVTNAIKRKYKNIPEMDKQFGNSLVRDALNVTSGKLHDLIAIFGRELNINTQSLSDKFKKKYK